MGADAAIRLRDGRTLSYGEWGPPDGVPVLGFHGGGLSRLQHYGEEAPTAAGVRLVLPDRPGCGRSDFHLPVSLLDWARDVEELADRLDLDRFAVFGVSAGGPPALACGYALRTRVAAVGLVGAVGPYVDEPELLRYLDPERRRLVGLALADPETALAEARLQCEEETRLLATNAEGLLDAWPPGTPESDRELMADPQIRARFLAAFRETAARGPDGAFYDTVLHYVRPWGFRLEDVRVPVLIWHGDRDTHVPVEAARLLAARIPSARLTVFAGEGHAVDYRHIEKILAELAAAVGRNPRSPAAGFGQLPMHGARTERIIGEDKEVANVSVHVEAARIPDRNRLLRELRLAGLDARPVGEIAIEVPYDGDPENVSDELFSHAEDVIMSIGAPFVPIKHEGVIYIRPPLS